MTGTSHPIARRPLFRALACAVLLAGASTAWAGSGEDARAQNAIRVMTDIQAIPESAIPDKLLDEARGLVVVPDTIKAGLILGGRRGVGLMSVKTADGTWSNPVFVKLTGGSIGLQAGVQSSDVVLAFRSDRGLESIVNGKFTLGADAGVAAGPMGRSAATATDGEFKAEIWSWSRARGLFAGVALDGAVLSIDHDANAAAYGANVTPRMIFEGRTNQPSGAIVNFRDMLEEATATARARRGTTNVNVANRAPARTGTTVVDPVTTPVQAQGAPAEANPQPFQSVDNPAQVEALPTTP